MSGRWRLPTRSGELVLGTVAGDSTVGDGVVALETVHWGAPGGERSRQHRRRSSFEADLDLHPLEVTALGTRTVHAAELVARRADGVSGARLTLTGEPAVSRHGSAHELRASLADEVLGLQVELVVRTDEAHEVVAKHCVLRNVSDRPIELARAWGAAFTPPVGPGARVGTLTGTWSREFTPSVTDLAAGVLSLGSRQGITSHTASPVLTLSPRASPSSSSSPAPAPGTYAVALSWSGSWRLAVEAVPFADHVRVSGGPDDESGVLTLAPGQELTTPVLTGLWVPGGSEEVAQAWHAYQRTLARPSGVDPAVRLSAEHRPVVYNSWYATGFDVTVAGQLALADRAAQLGAEVFVVDDGWFRGRVSDRAGLGDWDVDASKFPDGLPPLVDGVRQRGMRFGLWVEPEAVNPDSDLFRAHPDWIHAVPGRAPGTRRHQYVLDLGRPEVEAWVIATLTGLLERQEISYLKWDMNRPVADGRAPDWSWRHTQAYYRVMHTLRARFPQVTVEACAGGGGRIDNAVLALADVVWPSDETGPRDRLAIQHGYLSAYPAWTMSSWVTDEPDVLDPDAASLEFRFVVAMAGVLGVGGDLLAWSPDQLTRAAELVALYRQLRPVLHGGLVRRHGTPADPAYAVQYTTTDRVVLLAWARPGGSGRPQPWSVRLGDLDRSAGYRGGISAAHLMDEGLSVRWAYGDCDVVILDRV